MAREAGRQDKEHRDLHTKAVKLRKCRRKRIQITYTLLGLSSLHSTYIFSLIIKSILQWRKKLFPRASLSPGKQLIVVTLKEFKKKKKHSEWQSLREECLIGGTSGANPPFNSFEFMPDHDRWKKEMLHSFNKYLLRTFYLKMLKKDFQSRWRHR